MVELRSCRLNLDGLLELMPRLIEIIHAQVHISFVVEDVGVTRVDFQGRIEVIKSISLGPLVA